MGVSAGLLCSLFSLSRPDVLLPLPPYAGGEGGEGGQPGRVSEQHAVWVTPGQLLATPRIPQLGAARARRLVSRTLGD